MRSKLSHASHLLLYGEESRAAKVTVFVLAALAFCWVPMFGVICVHLFYEDSVPPKWINQLALTCALSNVVISPILYAYRSKRVLRDVKKALGLTKARSILKTKDRRAKKSKESKMKSVSCPQLLVSSVVDNETSTSVTNKSIVEQFLKSEKTSALGRNGGRPILNSWSSLPPQLCDNKSDVML